MGLLHLTTVLACIGQYLMFVSAVQIGKGTYDQSAIWLVDCNNNGVKDSRAWYFNDYNTASYGTFFTQAKSQRINWADGQTHSFSSPTSAELRIRIFPAATSAPYKALVGVGNRPAVDAIQKRNLPCYKVPLPFWTAGPGYTCVKMYECRNTPDVVLDIDFKGTVRGGAWVAHAFASAAEAGFDSTSSAPLVVPLINDVERSSTARFDVTGSDPSGLAVYEIIGNDVFYGTVECSRYGFNCNQWGGGVFSGASARSIAVTAYYGIDHSQSLKITAWRNDGTDSPTGTCSPGSLGTSAALNVVGAFVAIFNPVAGGLILVAGGASGAIGTFCS